MTMHEEQNKDVLFIPSSCGEKDAESCKKCKYCYTPTESCIHTRRCFMSGEYCSQQSNIQRERGKLYAEKSIRAFVIMNFSDMSDVVYEWRIKSFVKSLSAYLYFDEQNQRLYCSSVEDDGRWDKDKMVKNIEVVRSDSDPASNYVVCNRICQQLQIADLVIVDVSSQNANVFYEFGMAVALGKMILPICYSESYYKMVIPEELKDRYWKRDKLGEIAHHIGLFPWRKDLFEYYGIRYKEIKPNEADDEKSSKSCDESQRTRYVTFENAVEPENGFPDMKYARFPYHEVISKKKDKDSKKKKEPIGQEIYNKLSKEYNDAEMADNTLIVYTMDAFLNKEQAGQCIVNFFRNITARMNQEKCFSGERVGVLVQENVIPENEKDAKGHIDIFYNIGEIIQIGTNQATYLAAEEKIYSNDDFSDLEGVKQENITEQGLAQRRKIERFVKEHSKNRAMRIYPNNPVFVDRMKNLLHKDILETGKMEEGQSGNCCNLDSFCLYHVMLRTLRYTNEIVVDISDNCLQSLFWLGAAHGSDIYAITVIHEKTDAEKNYARETDVEKGKSLQNIDKKEKRNVFDVSGLWMAILKKNDTEGFYQQLVSAQSGIERHSKLMLANNVSYKQKMKELIFPGSDAELCKSEPKKIFEELLFKKNKDEREKMESYYRDRFWKPLLSYNQLCIYLSQMNEKGLGDQEPRLCMSKWDYDAVAVFSNYLSKRKVIGEYLLVSLPLGGSRRKPELNPRKINFVCVGSEVHPLDESLPEYISEKIGIPSDEYARISGINIIHKKWTEFDDKECKNKDRVFKGFERIGDTGKGILTHHPKTRKCIDCIRLKKNADAQKDKKGEDSNIGVIYSSNEMIGEKCCLVKDGRHCEIAQLILWREESQNSHDRDYFWVAISGSSGPATEALSMLFVTREQRKFQQDQRDDCLLYDLQEVVRKKVIEVFFMKLRKRLGEIELEFCDEMGNKEEFVGDEQKERYFALVEHAVSSYLGTVFYRYFFPLLSEKDIDRICNGMYTFVNSMKAAKISPFAFDYHSNRDRKYSSFVSNDGIDTIVDEIPKTLRAVLKSFRGLEAFYNVTVHHCLEKNDENEDTREIVSIERWNDNRFSSVNCFFV
ncbi:MAG: hypothetical protein K2O59_03570 [Lachnospiraceae bacterium]|nr:hypothetical protein [Lachnospiraceae bacterium]